MALVNATSNVLFMPYMAAFHASYLTAYFVGVGLSALFPSVVSIIQGSGSDCIVVNGTSVRTASALRFGVTEYYLIIFAWMVVATVAFAMLARSKTTVEKKSSTPAALPANTPTDESSPLSVSESDRYAEMGTSRDTSVADKLHCGLLLFLMAVVNAQMNGIIPSVQSYASLPYSQTTYHFGLTLSNVFSPLVCFLPLIVKTCRISVLALLAMASSALTGVIVVSVTVAASALNSFLRTVLATVLSENTADSEKRLFWGGVFIQIGSFLGSCIMFPLVNIFHLFVSAPSCPQ
ncbi:unnamed protein product [Gongylonema pulchrum]|uniref:Riboflavin transporter n=1 Tax=Gongylonema pulchrum TaxID=637853 RepID=A0A183E6X8_9BILA|nr:unnamed protein product [Gongylonema pulchrum]